MTDARARGLRFNALLAAVGEEYARALVRVTALERQLVAQRESFERQLAAQGEALESQTRSAPRAAQSRIVASRGCGLSPSAIRVPLPPAAIQLEAPASRRPRYTVARAYLLAVRSWNALASLSEYAWVGQQVSRAEINQALVAVGRIGITLGECVRARQDRHLAKLAHRRLRERLWRGSLRLARLS